MGIISGYLRYSGIQPNSTAFVNSPFSKQRAFSVRKIACFHVRGFSARLKTEGPNAMNLRGETKLAPWSLWWQVRQMSQWLSTAWRIKDWHRWFLNSWLFKVDLPSIRPSTSLNHLYSLSQSSILKSGFSVAEVGTTHKTGDLLQGVEALLCGKAQNWEHRGLAGIQSGCFRLPKKQFCHNFVAACGSHRLDFGKWFQTLHGSIGHTTGYLRQLQLSVETSYDSIHRARVQGGLSRDGNSRYKEPFLQRNWQSISFWIEMIEIPQLWVFNFVSVLKLGCIMHQTLSTGVDLQRSTHVRYSCHYIVGWWLVGGLWINRN